MSQPEHCANQTPPASCTATTSSREWMAFDLLRSQLSVRIIGQQALVSRLLVALLCDGHLLVEGVPGLAKTAAVKALAARLEGDFHRIQFTPDLLPADLTGTDIYRPQDGSFSFQPGPLFHNIVLADEVNRAPAKVQSALLEAMEERQITVGRTTHPLPRLFLVMATQNPIEQDGTYALPEAQLDRFLLHVRVDYPAPSTEQQILSLARSQARTEQTANSDKTLPSMAIDTVFAARQGVLDVFLAPHLEQYLVELVLATRNPSRYATQLVRWIRLGASPRATIGLDRCARAIAWLAGRDYVSPDDIQAIAPDVLRHRLLLSYEAQAEGVNTDDVISELLKMVPVP